MHTLMSIANKGKGVLSDTLYMSVNAGTNISQRPLECNTNIAKYIQDLETHRFLYIVQVLKVLDY